jgi:hypothetical protein
MSFFISFSFFFSGNSGMGRYHGQHSFNHPSHMRSCPIKKLNMEGVNSMRYPPHTSKKLSWARFFILKQINVGRLRRLAMLTVFSALAAFVVQVQHSHAMCFSALLATEPILSDFIRACLAEDKGAFYSLKGSTRSQTNNYKV